jgi:hypothetical protein
MILDFAVGNTSNIALLRCITKCLVSSSTIRCREDLICRLSRRRTPIPGDVPQSREVGSQFWPLASHSPILDIPPDPEAIDTIHEYFGTLGLFLPVVHEDSFIAAYEHGRRNRFRSVRRSWLALLYMVFAHVHLTRTATSPSNEATETAGKFFQKALALAVPEAILGTSLEISMKTPPGRSRESG